MSKAYCNCAVTFVQETPNAILVQPLSGLVANQWIPKSVLSFKTKTKLQSFSWGDKVEIEVQEWKAREAKLI